MDEAALRREVRAFIAEQVDVLGIRLECDAWLSGFSAEFSRAQGARGWLGMTWPAEYGGHARSERERWIVNEELLAAGAPVAAHWIGDRQSGPAILKHGSEEQKQRFLPAMARGECFFAIGMSEPDSGSDLASVRTTARRDGDHWVLNGTKVWTSGAHRADFMIALVRTSPVDPKARHQGLTQFIVDLRAPGITVNPIVSLDGGHHFNEVVLEDVRLTDADLLGNEGDGWTQVTSELAYERSGPERFLSTFPLLAAAADAASAPSSAELGQAVAELTTLRAMSAEVADALGRGQAPAVEAALVKDLGTRFEGRVIELARRLHPGEPDPDSPGDLTRHLAHAVTHSPGFTLRGGTNEILRGIVAKSLTAEPVKPSSEAAAAVAAMCAATEVFEPSGVWSAELGRALLKKMLDDGWHRVGLAEELGGHGGTLRDAADVTAALVGSPSPLADTLIVAAELLGRCGLALPADAEIVIVLPAAEAALGARLTATAARVPWACWASHFLVPVADGARTIVALVRADAATITPGRNVADEPRDHVAIDAVPVATASLDAPPADALLSIELTGALTRSVQLAAALARLVPLTTMHVSDRVQFGRPLLQFQAVQQSLAELAAEASAASAITDLALSAASTCRGPHLIAAAKARTSAAAGAGARIAHQLHGAIGVSQEHTLHRYTRALFSWRDEFGNEAAWGAWLAARYAAEAEGALWAWLVDQ
jgi:alkylation response protein AidB-like acyl-CoA dehydrogenase